MTTRNDNQVTYVPTTIIYPGETLQEVLEEHGMTQAELARRIGRPLKTINEIVKGKAPITAETAFQLEQVFGISASFWNSLEANHRELIARIEAEKVYAQWIEEARTYPYSEMAKCGWVENTSNQIQRVKNLLSFFGATSFDNIIEKGAFRISSKQSHSLPAVTAWLRKGSIDGAKIETQDFDSRKLKDCLGHLRSLTNNDNPNELMLQIRETLAGCGIAFVVTKNLPRAPINGATRWLTPSKALVQMSIRNSYSDIFWFSLFHEIGHIVLGNKKDFSVDLKSVKSDEELERKVDQFAQDLLIPSQAYEKFIEFLEAQGSHKNLYTACSHFAHQIDIHPGIVLGRLQHDEVIPKTMHGLRTQFKWAE